MEEIKVEERKKGNNKEHIGKRGYLLKQVEEMELLGCNFMEIEMMQKVSGEKKTFQVYKEVPIEKVEKEELLDEFLKYLEETQKHINSRSFVYEYLKYVERIVRNGIQMKLENIKGKIHTSFSVNKNYTLQFDESCLVNTDSFCTFEIKFCETWLKLNGN